LTGNRPKVSDVLGEAEARLAFRVSLATVRRLGLHGLDAEDAAAKAVLNAARSWEAFADDGEDGARERWLATLASNVARDAHRRKRTQALGDPMLNVTQQALHLRSRPLMPETVALNDAARTQRQQLFDSLAPRLAALVPVVARQVAGDLSREEAANLVGLSVHTYDKRATKLKEALKDAVAERLIQVKELFEVDQAREGRG